MSDLIYRPILTRVNDNMCNDLSRAGSLAQVITHNIIIVHARKNLVKRLHLAVRVRLQLVKLLLLGVRP